jgi:O-antigen/teichoic acid export membrane protein
MIDARFRSDALVGYAAQAIAVVCSFAFMAVVTRAGGIGVFGAVVVLVALASVLSNLASFRTNEAVIAFWKQGEAADDPGRGKFALLAGISIDLAIAVLLCGLVRWQAPNIAASLLGDAALAPAVELHGLVILVAFLRGTPLAWLQATGRFRVVYFLETLDHCVKAAIVTAAALAGATLALRDVVLAMLTAAACVTAPAALLLLSALAGPLRKVKTSRERALVREYARFSSTTFVSSALKAGNQQIDTLVLGYLTDTRIAGVYGMFRQFVAPFGFLSAPFAALAYPRFVQAVSHRRNRDVRAAIDTVNRRLVLAYAGAAVVVAPLMYLYARRMGIDLTGTQLLAFALVLLAAVNNGMLWWARPFSNSVDPRLSLVANLAATVFLLASIYPLTLAFGMTGTAAAVCALALMLTGYWQRAVRRHA